MAMALEKRTATSAIHVRLRPRTSMRGGARMKQKPHKNAPSAWSGLAAACAASAVLMMTASLTGLSPSVWRLDLEMAVESGGQLRDEEPRLSTDGEAGAELSAHPARLCGPERTIRSGPTHQSASEKYTSQATATRLRTSVTEPRCPPGFPAASSRTTAARMLLQESECREHAEDDAASRVSRARRS